MVRECRVCINAACNPRMLWCGVMRNHSGFAHVRGRRCRMIGGCKIGGPTRDICRRQTSGLTKPKDRTRGMVRSRRGKLADHEMLNSTRIAAGFAALPARPWADASLPMRWREHRTRPANASDASEVPRMPKGFRTDADNKGWRN
jgi:hypothetical protein